MCFPELLLLVQDRATVAVVRDESTVTAAAGFEGGIDLLALLGIEEGRQARVGVPAERLPGMVAELGVRS